MNNLRTTLSYFVLRIVYLLRNTHHASRITILLLPVLLSGCQFYRVAAPPADYYYLNSNKDLSAIGRVALVELDNDSSYPQTSTDVTKLLFQALQKRQVFGLSIVRRSDSAWRSLQLDQDSGPGASTYSLEQLSAIRKALKCNAVLIGTIAEFEPYPHTTIGLRLRLVDLKDGQLLWAIEHIWDSADKTTEYRIKKYFDSQMRSDFAPLNEQLVVVSSLEFIKFVAYEVAETLQPGSQTQR